MSDDVSRVSAIPSSPFHPYSAIVTLILDNLLGSIDIVSPLTIPLTCITAGLVNTLVVTLVQHNIAGDTWGVAISKGAVLGVVAGVPFPVTGTVVGGTLLGWAGLNKLLLKAPEEKQDF